MLLLNFFPILPLDHCNGNLNCIRLCCIDYCVDFISCESQGRSRWFCLLIRHSCTFHRILVYFCIISNIVECCRLLCRKKIQIQIKWVILSNQEECWLSTQMHYSFIITLLQHYGGDDTKALLSDIILSC